MIIQLCHDSSFPESIAWSQKSTTKDVAQLITTTIREIEAARQTLINTTHPLHPVEVVIRRLRWARRHLNFHLKPDMMSITAFFKHSIIDCTCNWCLAYEDRMLVLTRFTGLSFSFYRYTNGSGKRAGI